MLAVDIGQKRVRIVTGKPTREKPRVLQALDLEIPESVDRTQATSMGRWLRQELDAAGIADRIAVATIDRKSLVLKATPIEGVADHELSDVVRLQATRELTLPVEEAVVDFVRVEPRTPDEPPLAIFAVARKQSIDEYRQIFASADLTLAGLLPGPLAQVQFAPADPAGAEPPFRLLVVSDGEAIEVSLLHGNNCLINVARPMSAKVTDGSKTSEPAGTFAETATVLQTIRRLRASWATQWPDLRIQSVLVAGQPASTPGLAEELNAELGAETQWFDPLVSLPNASVVAENRGSFTEAVGSLLLASRPIKERIDFLAPKKSVPKRDYRRMIALGGVGIAAAILLQVYLYRDGELKRFQTQLAKIKESEKLAVKELKSLEPEKTKLAVLQNWRDREVIWIELLANISKQFPDVKRVYLTTMNLSRASGSSDQRATLAVEGFADKRETVVEFFAKLSTNKSLDVRPGPVQPAPLNSGYPWRFSAVITLSAAASEDAPAKKS